MLHTPSESMFPIANDSFDTDWNAAPSQRLCNVSVIVCWMSTELLALEFENSDKIPESDDAFCIVDACAIATAVCAWLHVASCNKYWSPMFTPVLQLTFPVETLFASIVCAAEAEHELDTLRSMPCAIAATFDDNAEFPAPILCCP